MLEWPSSRPLGDPLRPPPMFMDTGLLQHWGLRLNAPEERGVTSRKLGAFDVLTVSPGSLHGGCAISADRLAAHCRIGRGRAIIVADADFLDPSLLGEGAKQCTRGAHTRRAGSALPRQHVDRATRLQISESLSGEGMFFRR